MSPNPAPLLPRKPSGPAAQISRLRHKYFQPGGQTPER